MFNTTDIHQSMNITQQPNDAADAARLYGELEEKALRRIKYAAILDLPSINAKVAHFEISRRIESLDNVHEIGINLNGKPVRVTKAYMVDTGNHISHDPMLAIVYAVAGAIKEEIVRKLLDHRTTLHLLNQIRMRSY